MNPVTQFKKILLLPIPIALGLIAFASPPVVHADAVLDWNGYAASAIVGVASMPPPRGLIRLAMVHVAIYDAVNAIEGYPFTPYAVTPNVVTPASPEAATAAAAHDILVALFPSQQAVLDAQYAASLALIPDGPAKSGGIATGAAAATQMIALRVGDGSSPPQFYLPASTDPGVWQLTPSCPAAGGVGFQWQNMTPFGVPSAPRSQAWIAQFAPGPPPALTSERYARDYNEVKGSAA